MRQLVGRISAGGGDAAVSCSGLLQDADPVAIDKQGVLQGLLRAVVVGPRGLAVALDVWITPHANP